MFEQFLSNEVLRGAYRGRRLKVVLHYVLAVSLKHGGEQSLDTLLRQCANELPLNKLSASQIRKLNSFADSAMYPQAAMRIRERARALSAAEQSGRSAP